LFGIGCVPSWLERAETAIVLPAVIDVLPPTNAVTIGFKVAVAMESPTAATPTFTPVADESRSAMDDATTVTPPVTVTSAFARSTPSRSAGTLAIAIVPLPVKTPAATPTTRPSPCHSHSR
jgi:hypothetical protein